MRRPLLTLAVLAPLALAAGAAPAPAAGPGETFLTGGLDLPAGAISGGRGGWDGDAADRSSASDDGRYVAFTAQADTLDAAAHPDVANVYRKDRLTGAVVLVSRATGANGAAFALRSQQPAISDDGARVAFRTTAALDPADTDGGRADVYVRDVDAGTTTLASVRTGGGQTLQALTGGFDLSGDGQFVVFATAEALVAADANAFADVYRRSLAGNTTELVSDDAAGGARAANAASLEPAVSDDGTWVAFVSSATDLTAPFTAGGGAQAFARDMTARLNHLVSARSGAPTTGANDAAAEVDVAGRPATARPEQVYVAYTSYGSDLDAADGARQASIFRRRLSPGTPASVLVSRGGGDGPNADSRAHTPSIGDDGATVVFSSDATTLGAGADYYGVYLRDVASRTTRLASADNAYAVQGAIAGAGGFVTWYEGAGVTADSDPDQSAVFGRTHAAPSTLGAVELVSRPPGSAPFLFTAFEVDPSGSGARTVSADGRYVAFESYSSRLPGAVVAGPALIYRRDTLTGVIEVVSRANGAAGAPVSVGGFTDEPTISADGTRVAFVTSAPLDPVHGDASSQVYVRDLVAGTTTLASRAEGATGALPDDGVQVPRMSADGRHVAFVTAATNLGAPGGRAHAYLRDLDGAHTTLVDRADGVGGAIGGEDVDAVSPSADGRLVAFSSRAANLHPDDTADNLRDVYVRDLVAGRTTLASRRGGLAGQHASGSSTQPSLSADGTVVAFRAEDETLAPEAGGWGGLEQIVARTLATGANTLVSRAPGGTPADDGAGDPSVSGDGGVVAFAAAATNLLPGVGGGTRDGAFARTMATGALSGPPAFGILDNQPQNRASFPSVSDDGQCLAFTARGHNAVTGTAGDLMTAYVYVVSGTCPKALPVRARRAAAARRPTLTRASLLRKRFRVGRRATPRLAAQPAARRRGGRRARRAPVGTAFRFTLNTQARVTIVLERPAPGRLVGRFCRRPAPRLRRDLRCVRFVEAGRIVRTGVRAGRASIAFSGRIGRRALRPGTYRARLRAGNGSGVSRWVRLGFRVVRR